MLVVGSPEGVWTWAKGPAATRSMSDWTPPNGSEGLGQPGRSRAQIRGPTPRPSHLRSILKALLGTECRSRGPVRGAGRREVGLSNGLCLRAEFLGPPDPDPKRLRSRMDCTKATGERWPSPGAWTSTAAHASPNAWCGPLAVCGHQRSRLNGAVSGRGGQ